MRAAAAEDEEHLFVGDAENAEALAGFEQAKSKLVLVEANRAGKIAGEEAGFDDAVDAWGGHDCFSSRSKREIPCRVYRVPFGAAMATLPIWRRRAIRFIAR